MTTVYGVTGYGAKLQIAKQLKDIDEFPQDKVNEGIVHSRMVLVVRPPSLKYFANCPHTKRLTFP